MAGGVLRFHTLPLPWMKEILVKEDEGERLKIKKKEGGRGERENKIKRERDR